MLFSDQNILKTNPTIFSRKHLEAKAKGFRLDTIEGIEEKKKRLAGWIKGIKDGSITSKKEEALDHDFLNLFFGEILDYEYKAGEELINLEKQLKNQTDSKKSDGSLGFFNLQTGTQTVKAVIELKDGQTDLDKPQNRKNDHRTPVQQAFDYASDAGGNCNWVIVSNFIEIRLYNYRDRGKYEHIYIPELLENPVELQRFFFLLHKNQLIHPKNPSAIDILYAERLTEEANITNRFYAEYKQLRVELFNNLKELNPKIDPLLLLNKTQKIFDRIIFICFCEDTIPELIPGSTIKRMIESAKNQPFNDSEDLLWKYTKGLFLAMDKGNLKANINPFNGGLFAKDDIIDKLTVDEAILEKILNLYKWDFESELNVNVLGHIFEQSISDLEKMTFQITHQYKLDSGTTSTLVVETETDSKSKRKQEGVFYTPEYITSYIVEETIGTWIEDQKLELGFYDLIAIEPDEYADLEKKAKVKAERKNLLKEKVKPHRDFWLTFLYRLQNIKILDPACGSGAFLVQSFNYLYKQHQIITTELKKLNLDVIPENFKEDWWEIQKHILTHNLYGVDLNFESVEITKLSLWIKTANRKKKLSFIDNNILCGNSLIEDKAIAGDKAFVWKKAFKDVFDDGGFDIVVGNPPYVRQELLGKATKEYYVKQFPNVGNGTADLYVYFYELGIKMLKPNGLLGFITPNKWMERSYGDELRAFLKPKHILKIVNYGELPIFDEAATEPAVIIIKNETNDLQISYAAITNIDDAINSKKYIFQSFSKSNLKIDIWKFTNNETTSILAKFYANSTTIDEYTSSGVLYGIKTGLNEVFIIDQEVKNDIVKKNSESERIIKKLVEGEDFDKWNTKFSGKYLLATEFDLDIPKLYPSVFKHLKKFEKQLIARQDQGKNWWNLRACVYYDKFANAKLIYYHTAINHNFYFDTEGYYISANCYMIANADRFLQCILNSNVFNYVKKFLFPAFGNPEDRGRVRLDANKMTGLPIPIVSEIAKKSFEEKSITLHQKSKELYEKSTSFISLFIADIAKPQLLELPEYAQNHDMSKVAKKFRNWYLHDFDKFLELAKKEKIKLSLKQKAEWQSHFAEEFKICSKLDAEIKALESEVNQMVYALYELTTEEIGIIEKT